ncbi:MAG: hypothetical protein R2939_16195 [Kofleriaceae bacterium]
MGAGRRGAAAPALAQLEGLAPPFAELEARLLPARVGDYAPRMLDELGAMGEVVWVGRGLAGPRDGRVAIVGRERASLLLSPGEVPADATPLHHALVAHLAQHGASFLVALELAAGDAGRAAVRAALWDLVWAGVVTNDTFAPLRSLRGKPDRRATPTATFGGRWALVASLCTPTASPMARARAQAQALLDRWGVVTREAVAADGVAGGFAALAPMFDALEEAGVVRRGYFVDGLGGRQYAAAGTVDRLRADDDGGVVVLATLDPANVWGALVAWPDAHGGARPSRRAGTSVILVDGRPALLVDPRSGRVTTFEHVDDAALARAVRDGLPRVPGVARRAVVVREIDGGPALAWPHAALLDGAGFRRDYRGFVAGGSAS